VAFDAAFLMISLKYVGPLNVNPDLRVDRYASITPLIPFTSWVGPHWKQLFSTPWNFAPNPSTGIFLSESYFISMDEMAVKTFSYSLSNPSGLM
jgi:hypothetical protein